MRNERRRTRSGREKILFRRNLIIIASLVIIVGLGIFFVIKTKQDHSDITPTLDVSELNGPEPDTTVFDTNAKRKQHVNEVIEQANRMIMGYDYDGAIRLIKQDPDYKETLELLELVEHLEMEKTSLPAWNNGTKVTLLAFNAIVHESRFAFDGDDTAKKYNNNNLTEKEFRAILQKLYDSNYILVNMHQLSEEKEVKQADGSVKRQRTKKTLFIPENKTPIVFVQLDPNFVKSMRSDGFASGLVIKKDTLTARYDSEDGTTYGAFDYITILNEFIDEHPDFSYCNAHGVLAISPSEGIFGYDISDPSADGYANSIKQIQGIRDYLVNNGYEIANGSYYNKTIYDFGINDFKVDFLNWQKTAGVLLGDTDIYVWPNGKDSGWKLYSDDKYQYLKSKGYHFYCSLINPQEPYWVQISDTYYRMGWIDVTGARLYNDMKNNKTILKFLFDASEIYDTAGRPFVY